jgi:hypothetical protein
MNRAFRIDRHRTLEIDPLGTASSSSMICRMLSTLTKRFLLILSPAMLLLALGCGGGVKDRGAITGTVKLDGKPVEKGSILFTPIEGASGTVAGGEIENGRYQLSEANGPAIGSNRVEIRAMRKTGKMIPKPFSPPGTMIAEQIEVIPPRFNSESTLMVDVKAGDNAADFEVSSQ